MHSDVLTYPFAQSRLRYVLARLYYLMVAALLLLQTVRKIAKKVQFGETSLTGLRAKSYVFFLIGAVISLFFNVLFRVLQYELDWA